MNLLQSYNVLIQINFKNIKYQEGIIETTPERAIQKCFEDNKLKLLDGSKAKVFVETEQKFKFVYEIEGCWIPEDLEN